VPTKTPTYPHVLAGQNGEALYYQRPGYPAFFVSGPVEQRTYSSLAPKTVRRTGLINGAVAVATIEVLLHAGASFHESREDRPPSASPDDLLLEFTLPNGLRVFYCGRDRTVILDSRWFENRGAGLVVGPTLYRGTPSVLPSPLPEIGVPPVDTPLAANRSSHSIESHEKSS